MDNQTALALLCALSLAVIGGVSLLVLMRGRSD